MGGGDDIDKTDAERLLRYVESLESLAGIVEAENGGTELDARRAEVEGLERVISVLRREAYTDAWTEAHPYVRCGAGDCGEDFTYCPDGNHFCPYCGETGG